MPNVNEKMASLQRKSHAALLRLLNNIGVVGAALAAAADLIFVIITVVGLNVEVDSFGIILFSVVNACIGVLISVLLRYQGVKYAEIENEELCKQYYNKTVKERKHLSMSTWMALKSLQDIIIKGCTTAFCLFGALYITVQGSKNPVQLLITLATLLLFACFGLISMNSAYMRYYNVQVPMMQLAIREREEKTDNPAELAAVDLPIDDFTSEPLSPDEIQNIIGGRGNHDNS